MTEVEKIKEEWKEEWKEDDSLKKMRISQRNYSIFIPNSISYLNSTKKYS